MGETVADIYVRISKIKHRGRRETLGVERQEPPCRAFCEQQGWRVRKVWVDNGVSAVKAKHRKEFEAMLADVRAGKVDAVVSWQADRLLRTVEDASAIVAMARQHGTTVANVGGTLDLTTAAGRRKLYDLAVSAQYESELRGERLQLKHNELGEAGAWWGGKWRPFGFQIDGVKLHDRHDDACDRTDDDRCPMADCRLVQDPAEAAEIRRQVAAAVERGATVSGIASDWNRRHVTRAGGGGWQAREVRELLTNPRIAGLRRWKGKTYPAVWEAIIDPETFQRLQLALANPAPSARLGRGPLPRSYLLSGGLAVCGGTYEDGKPCGRPLRPHKQKGRRTYRCESQHGGCGKVARFADPLEDYVRDLVLAAYDDPAMGPQLRGQLGAKAAGNGLQALLNEHETLRTKETALGNLLEAVDQAGLAATDLHLPDRAELERALGRVVARLYEVEAEITTATPKRLPVDLPEGYDALQAAWQGWSMEQQRAVVAFALEQVVVRPVGRGYRFDGDRDLTLRWRPLDQGPS